MKRDCVIAGVLGALFVWTRFYIFGSSRVTITPQMYQKPPPIEAFALVKKGIPAGWALAPAATGGAKNPELFKPDVELPRFPQAPFPERPRISRVYVASYVGSNGEHLDLVTVSYGKTAAERHPPAALVERLAKTPDPTLHVEDYFVTWIDAVPSESGALFRAPILDQIAQARKSREWLEKLIVLTKAYLQLLINLLVGAFGFILALFFVKHFLITRQVEGKG